MNELTVSEAIACALQSWRPGIGDPHLMGWVTVFVYVVTSLICLVLVARGRFDGESSWHERVFWGGLGVVLAFLAVNKQLDLQSFMTAVGRCMAQAQGWYDIREAVQRDFILGLIMVVTILAVVILWLLHGTLRRNGLAVAGFILVLGFVLIRAVSFHQMDMLIGAEFMTVRMNWVLELSGLVLILVAGLRRIKY